MAVSIGLELGNQVVRAVCLERVGSQLRLTKAIEVPWSGTAEDDLTAALARVRKTLGTSGPVILGLPTDASIVATVEPLIVNRKRSELAIQFELQQHLAYDVATAVWHYAWYPGKGRASSDARHFLAGKEGTGSVTAASSGARHFLAGKEGSGSVSTPARAGSQVVVAAVKQSLVDARLKTCHRGGFAVREVGIAALALVNIWARGQRTGRGRAGAARGQTQAGTPATEVLLHIDGDTREWIVIGQHGVQVFPIIMPEAPEGAQGPTSAADNPSVVGTSSVATPASGDTSSPPAARSPAGTVPARADQGQLLAIVKESWNGVRGALQGEAGAASPGEGTAHVWLLDESGTWSPLSGTLAQELGCSVEALEVSHVVNLGPANPSNPEHFFVALGLALQGMGGARLPLNLLVEMTRKRNVTRVRRGTLLVSFLAGVLAIGLGAAGMLTMLGAKDKGLSARTTQERTYRALRPKMRTMLKAQQEVAQRIAQLQAITDSHDVTVRMFHQLAEALPDDVWLTASDFSKPGVVTGTFEGVASSFQVMNRLIEDLKSTVGWADVKPLSTRVRVNPTTETEEVIFTIEFRQPVPGVSDVASAKPSAAASGDERARSRRGTAR